MRLVYRTLSLSYPSVLLVAVVTTEPGCCRRRNLSNWAAAVRLHKRQDRG
jgi:hypothetical protein